jgi:tetratricopeptide (TPR) repeat protein
MLRNSNYSKGAHYLEMAVKYLSKYNSQDTLINFIVNGNLGYAYISTNQYDKTVSLLEECLRLNGNLVYLNIIPNIHNCLSIAYYNIGIYDKSIEHVKKCIFFYFYNGSANQAYACYINYLNALRYSRDFTKAFEVLNSVKEERITSSFFKGF